MSDEDRERTEETMLDVQSCLFNGRCGWQNFQVKSMISACGFVFHGESCFKVIAVNAHSSLIIIAVSGFSLKCVQSSLTLSSPDSPKKTHIPTCTNGISGHRDSSSGSLGSKVCISDYFYLIRATHQLYSCSRDLMIMLKLEGVIRRVNGYASI